VSKRLRQSGGRESKGRRRRRRRSPGGVRVELAADPVGWRALNFSLLPGS
jgi:hypothetical protein